MINQPSVESDVLIKRKCQIQYHDRGEGVAEGDKGQAREGSSAPHVGDRVDPKLTVMICAPTDDSTWGKES